MTIYDFIKMNEMEQAEAVLDAVLLADREDEEHKILLYQIDRFYIEVFYHKEYNVIRRFRPFKTTELLKPYLNKIDISELKKKGWFR